MRVKNNRGVCVATMPELDTSASDLAVYRQLRAAGLLKNQTFSALQFTHDGVYHERTGATLLVFEEEVHA